MNSQTLLNVRVITNSKNNQIKGFNDFTNTLEIKLKKIPVKGQANKELEKLLKKITGKPCKIVKGFKNKKKIVLIEEKKEVIFKKINPYLLL
ncbi:MAG: DUF167 domain-containing protein [archaeon]